MNKSKFAIFLIIISVFFATIMIACTKLAQLEVNVITAALLRFIFGMIIISPIIIKSKFSKYDLGMSLCRFCNKNWIILVISIIVDIFDYIVVYL